MKRNKIITRIISLSLLLVILVGCNINDLKEDDNKDNLDTSNIIISLDVNMVKTATKAYKMKNKTYWLL